MLFLLAAVLGFVLGYWYSRRNFEDVSESYKDLRKANARSDEAQWIRLWEKFSALPEPKETDLNGVLQRLDGVQAAVDNLPKLEPVDLESIETRLDSLNEGVRNIPIPIERQAVDLKPLETRLDSLAESVGNIRIPESPEPVNLTPVESALSALREDVKQLPVVETHDAVDLAPVNEKIERLHKGVRAIPQPQPVNLKPIDRRLTSIEKGLSRVTKRVANLKSKPVKTKRTTPRTEQRDQPRVLSAALYGKKDDLKLISGVGPKLEHLLNKNGVYYFWQVAEWNKRDINVIDERLDAFKGRITRDDWVSQARQLRRESSAAQMPNDA